jgi:glycine cleavage system aminomethyltransferase T
MSVVEPISGPLDDLLRQAGATMVVRDGRWVAAHYGSRAGEVAACRSAAGIADRSDRSTLEVRGSPDGVDRVVEAVTHRPASRTLAVRAGHAWWCRVDPGRVILRCESAWAGECRRALTQATAAEPGTAVADLTGTCAAIEVIGSRARQVLRAAGLNPLAAFSDDGPSLILLHEAGNSFEVLTSPAAAPDLWVRLHAAGRALGATSVGLDALEMIAAGDHLDAGSSAAVS